MNKVFYRLLTPTTFANLDFSNLEEAEQGLIEFGNVQKDSEYYNYWQEKKKQCKIVKITEITEEINKQN